MVLVPCECGARECQHHLHLKKKKKDLTFCSDLICRRGHIKPTEQDWSRNIPGDSTKTQRRQHKRQIKAPSLVELDTDSPHDFK